MATKVTTLHDCIKDMRSAVCDILNVCYGISDPHVPNEVEKHHLKRWYDLEVTVAEHARNYAAHLHCDTVGICVTIDDPQVLAVLAEQVNQRYNEWLTEVYGWLNKDHTEDDVASMGDLVEWMGDRTTITKPIPDYVRTELFDEGYSPEAASNELALAANYNLCSD
jgi:hypothetical protein